MTQRWHIGITTGNWHGAVRVGFDAPQSLMPHTMISSELRQREDGRWRRVYNRPLHERISTQMMELWLRVLIMLCFNPLFIILHYTRRFGRV